MARILKHLVLLTLVVELVLPAGWCCRPANATTTTASIDSRTEKSCCHSRTAQTEKPTRSHCPLPTSKCCCSNDTVAPEKPVWTFDLESMPALAFEFPAADSLCDLQLEAPGAFHTGPPLHVLLCVWTC